MMGAYDIFEIVATGRGAHAAMPHLGRDPMPFAAHVINALQTIVARNLHPLDGGVVSVTQVHGGDTWNVIPQEVVLRGTVRSFEPAVQDLIERRIGEIVTGVAATFGMTATFRYERRYPATINTPEETRHASRRPRRWWAPGTSTPIRRRRWAPRTSRSCCRQSPAATCGWATAADPARRTCTTRTTTSTTRYCRSARATG